MPRSRSRVGVREEALEQRAPDALAPVIGVDGEVHHVPGVGVARDDQVRDQLVVRRRRRSSGRSACVSSPREHRARPRRRVRAALDRVDRRRARRSAGDAPRSRDPRLRVGPAHVDGLGRGARRPAPRAPRRPAHGAHRRRAARPRRPPRAARGSGARRRRRRASPVRSRAGDVAGLLDDRGAVRAEGEHLAAARVDQRDRARRARRERRQRRDARARACRAPSASPRAVAMPMRSPVNDPGPQPTTIARQVRRASQPARARTSSTSTSARCAAWPPSALANASSRPSRTRPQTARAVALSSTSVDGACAPRTRAQTTDGGRRSAACRRRAPSMRTTACGGGSTPAPALAHSTKTRAHVVEVRLEIAPRRLVDALAAREVEVGDRPVAALVEVRDRERRARDRAGDAERARRAAHERRLAGAELALDVDDGAARQRRARAPRRAPRSRAQKRPSCCSSPASGRRDGWPRRARLGAARDGRAAEQLAEAPDVGLERGQQARVVERRGRVVERQQLDLAARELGPPRLPVQLRDAVLAARRARASRGRRARR